MNRSLRSLAFFELGQPRSGARLAQRLSCLVEQMQVLRGKVQHDAVAARMRGLAFDPQRDLRQAGGAAVEIALAAESLDQVDGDDQSGFAWRGEREVLGP